MAFPVDKQVELALQAIKAELTEKLLAGRRFSLQINGVRSKITEIQSGEVIRTEEGKNVIYKDVWHVKQK
jgi:hypothetical protein